ncbi:hypothetical protein MTO96_036911 [Rhipicephalus appendiculatus]
MALYVRKTMYCAYTYVNTQLCKLKEEHWTLKFRVAAMGVEYADTTKFRRLDRYGKMNRLRSIVDFITRNFTSQGSYSACNS